MVQKQMQNGSIPKKYGKNRQTGRFAMIFLENFLSSY